MIESLQTSNNWNLSSFQGISLDHLDEVRLMNRIDSKFVFHINELGGILDQVKEQYAVLDIEGKRQFQYESLYFDTDQFDLYRHHHNGRTNRVKVRFRKYIDTNTVYFEIKKKAKGIRTDKFRMEQVVMSHTLDEVLNTFLESHAVFQPELASKMLIFYNRITLASVATQERVTIDLNMAFDNFTQKKDFPTLVIAEVKQDRFSRISPFVGALRERNIRELKISKYSLSVAMMNDAIKKNSFKQKINKLNKIISN
jgi:hypothetical protein